MDFFFENGTKNRVHFLVRQSAEKKMSKIIELGDAQESHIRNIFIYLARSIMIGYIEFYIVNKIVIGYRNVCIQ